MIIKSNPILKKELRLSSRSIRIFLAIGIYVFFLSIVMMLGLDELLHRGRLWAGPEDFMRLSDLFAVIAWLQMGLICLIVPILSAGSIAGERERQTLDLMLTTPVSPLSIIWGKLLSVLVRVLLFVICSLPVMAVAFLYGGMQWQYLIIFFIGILCMAFFNGAIGIWCSTLFRRTVPAVIISIMIEVIFYLLTVAVVLLALRFQYRMAVENNSEVLVLGWLPILLLLSPGVSFVDAIQSAYAKQSLMGRFLTSYYYECRIQTPAVLKEIGRHWSLYGMAVCLILGIVFMLLAARNLRRGGEKKRLE